ncbi:heat shock protein 9/12-domain-containing protein [Aspergillus unguis]
MALAGPCGINAHSWLAGSCDVLSQASSHAGIFKSDCEEEPGTAGVVWIDKYRRHPLHSAVSKRDQGTVRKLYKPLRRPSSSPHHQLNQFKQSLSQHFRTHQISNNQTIKMSDTGRKDFSTKAQEKLTPDSTKSTQDKIKETVTDTGDRVARGTQPDDQKSTGQQIFDKGQRAKDNNVHGGASETITDKVKNAVGLGDH